MQVNSTKLLWPAEGKERWKMISLIILIGVFTGLATYLMKEAIKWVGIFVTHDTQADRSNLIFLLLPMLGIVGAMVFQRYVIKSDLSQGTAMIRRDLSDGQYQLAPSLMYSNILGCGWTIGLGGSAGAEGPSAYTGAAIASNLGRKFGMSQDWMRILVGVGAGAGIAGIFKSPVGGALFTLEVLGMEMLTLPVVILFCTCLISGCTALAFGGFAIDIKFVTHIPFNASNMAWFVVLGLVCGLYSLYYNATKQWMGRFLGRISNPWSKALLAGAALSIAIYLFPALFGEGYGILARIINGHGDHILDYGAFPTGLNSIGILMLGTACVLLLKGAMVSATIDGGGVAGDFAPTLFAGCLTGYLFGLAMNHWFGAGLPAENFALLGMAGVMSGALKAPLMAIFITAEMSDSYPFIFGFLVVGGIAYAVVMLLPQICRKKGTEVLSQNRDNKKE